MAATPYSIYAQVYKLIEGTHLLCRPLAAYSLEDVVSQLLESDQAYIGSINHTGSALRSAVARLLACQLFNQLHLPYPGVRHQTGGRPIAISGGAHLSLTHTADWAGAAISLHGPIGFDLETHAEKAERIAPRFLKAGELDFIRTSNIPASLAFCLKEATYKNESITGLSIRDDLTLEVIGAANASVLCHHPKALKPLHTLHWFKLGYTFGAVCY